MPDPIWQRHRLTLYCGDAIDVLRQLPAESVQCCVTSPPYWGLRDYGTAKWEGGDAGCDHKKPGATKLFGNPAFNENRPSRELTDTAGFRSVCRKCGARRIDLQLGLEPTPAEYIAKLVDVFREVRRVLRTDGTLWLNLGDSYAHNGPCGGGSPGGPRRPRETDASKQAEMQYRVPPGLKPKDLCGIPWRVALALQADGWWLRQDIIWAKPNPMPESVTDRCTKAHEYLFLLTKAERYYYDAEGVKERFADERNGNPGTYKWKQGDGGVAGGGPNSLHKGDGVVEGWNIDGAATGRNLRSVWTIPTAPYRGAHFATFPPRLVEPCIKAGTSERGACPKCGKPWQRILKRERRATRPGLASKVTGTGPMEHGNRDPERHVTEASTLGWSPGCPCNAGEPVPCVVLDPFIGAGTTALVAYRLGRRCVGIDLSEKYLREQAIPRLTAELAKAPLMTHGES